MITRKSLKNIILGSFCILGIITALPGFMIGARKTNISSVTSALLNPKYVSRTNVISLSFPDGCMLSLTKGLTNAGMEYWLCSADDGTSFPANSSIVAQLLERASQTRSMAQISDSFTAWSALGLSDDEAVNMTFGCIQNGGTEVFSSLFFGFENADATMQYVRNDRKATAWRIQDDFSSYLTDSMSFWADQRLLPTGSLNETDASRTCISVQTAEGNRRFYNNAGDGTHFDDMVHSLLSLRSSEICSPLYFASQASEPGLILTVTLEGASLKEASYGFDVYEVHYDDEDKYFVRNFGITGTGEAQYYQVISAWTLSKITEALSL